MGRRFEGGVRAQKRYDSIWTTAARLTYESETERLDEIERQAERESWNGGSYNTGISEELSHMTFTRF